MLSLLACGTSALRMPGAATRRQMGFAGAGACLGVPSVTLAAGLESRDRGLNEKTLLQSDFYFTTGRCPPRVLDVGQLPSDDPKWNAWGECAKTGSSNACTYVPLKQRYEAYSKYASTILAGSQDFFDVGAALKKSDFAAVSLLLWRLLRQPRRLRR